MEDWKRYRAIKMKSLNVSYENSVKCPVCGQSNKIKSMHCHHLIPKYVAPHLTFVVSNMVFVHIDCHKKIHEYMGDGKKKNVYTQEDLSEIKGQPFTWKKAELLEKYLELEGYFKAAETDMFNQKATYYMSPQRCPAWVKRWKRRY